VRKCRVGLFGEKKGYQKEDLFETIFFRTLLHINICFQTTQAFKKVPGSCYMFSTSPL